MRGIRRGWSTFLEISHCFLDARFFHQRLIPSWKVKFKIGSRSWLDKREPPRGSLKQPWHEKKESHGARRNLRHRRQEVYFCRVQTLPANIYFHAVLNKQRSRASFPASRPPLFQPARCINGSLAISNGRSTLCEIA